MTKYRLPVHKQETRRKFRVYCGPTIIKETADKLRFAGFEVTILGTEHVYFLAKEETAVQDVLRALGGSWTYKDVQLLA